MSVRVLDALIDGNAELGITAMADADSVADLRAVCEQFGLIAVQLAVLSTELDLADTGDRLAELAFGRETLIVQLRALAAKVQGQSL